MNTPFTQAAASPLGQACLRTRTLPFSLALLPLWMAFAFAPPSAQAQRAATELSQPVAQTFEIAAGPLPDALAAFARQAGISLVYSAAQLEGLQSAGLNGRYGVVDGLGVLLSGSGYRAVQVQGGIRIEADPAASASMLAPVLVTGANDAVTEGTGSYVDPGSLGTATPLGLTWRETPQSISVITNQRMEDQNLTTIQQVLGQVPGIKTGSLGSELSNASSRGYEITNYQFDGVNTFVEALGGGAVPSATTEDMAIYDHIEVLRGASGLVTGAGDPSGTINLVRKKPTADFQAAVEAGFGSWQDKRAVVDLSGSLNEARSLRGRFIAVGQDADSYIDHYGRKKGLFYGVLEADISSTTRLTAGVEHARTKVRGQGSFIGFPLWFDDGTRTDLPVSFTAASRDNTLKLKSTKMFATLEQRLGQDWRVKLSGNHSRSSHDEDRTVLDFSSAFFDRAGDGVTLLASQRNGNIEQSNVDMNVRGPFSLLGRRHELVLGAAYDDYKQSIDTYVDTSGLVGSAANLFTWDRRGKGVYGPVTIDSRYVMRQSSVYGAARFQLRDNLMLIAGTRVFWHDYDVKEDWNGGNYRSSSSEDGVFTPYGGIVYDFDPSHTAYASYATIYKPQTARDRYGVALDPLEGANYEVGLKSSWLDGKLTTSVALYQIRQDNLAEADPGYIVPGTLYTEASRAIKGSKTTGLDLEISGAITRDWNVTASWTYGQTKSAAGERVTTTFPSHMIKLWTTYRLPGALNRLVIGGGVNWQNKTYSKVNAWQTGQDLYWEQPSFAVANLMARYDFNDQLSATLNVNNVFDKKYIASVSDWWYAGTYGAPRSVFLSVKYQF